MKRILTASQHKALDSMATYEPEAQVVGWADSGRPGATGPIIRDQYGAAVMHENGDLFVIGP